MFSLCPLGHYRRCQPRTSASLMIHKEKVPRSLALGPGSPTQGQRNIQVLPFSLGTLCPQLPTVHLFPCDFPLPIHPQPTSHPIFSPSLLFCSPHPAFTEDPLGWGTCQGHVYLCVHRDTVCFMLRSLPPHMGCPEASH